MVATGRGDDGTTGLLFGGRIAKDDPRAEAYGTVDEAVAALGLARAELSAHSAPADAADGSDPGRADGSDPGRAELTQVLLRLQRELFVVGAELASNPDARERLRDGQTRVSEQMLEGLEQVLAEHEASIMMPREFVVPGETRASAALELARTIVRRGERRVVSLGREGLVAGEWLLPYLNRLADLLWVLARAAEAVEGRSTTLARTSGRGRRSE